MRERTYVAATTEALAHALAADARTFLLGHDIGEYGGRFQTTVGLQARFGPLRVREFVSGERSLVGILVGAAMVGARPILDLTLIDHLLASVGNFAHQLSMIPWLSQGRAPLPVVIRAAIGAGMSDGPYQAGNFHPLFAHLPGLRVVAPATPRDGKGLLAAAIACDEPVLLLEHKQLLSQPGEVPEEHYTLPLDRATVVQPGKDLTVAAYGPLVARGLEAARLLREQGLEAEVVDLRSLAPLDLPTLVTSVARTGRLLLLDDAYRSCSVMSEVAAEMAAHALDYLDAPIARMGAPDQSLAYSPALEALRMPTADEICDVARKLVDS